MRAPALLLALLLLPGAAAQEFQPTLTLTLADAVDPVAPGATMHPVQIHWVYNVREAPSAATLMLSDHITIRFEPATCAADWVTLDGPDSIEVPLGGPGIPQSTWEGDVTFHANASAEAGPTTSCTIEAQAERASPVIAPSNAATVEVLLNATRPASEAGPTGQAEPEDGDPGRASPAAGLASLLALAAVATLRRRKA